MIEGDSLNRANASDGANAADGAYSVDNAYSVDGANLSDATNAPGGANPKKSKKALKKAAAAVIVVIAAGALCFGAYTGYNWLRDRRARQALANAYSASMAAETVRTGAISQTVSASGVVRLQDEQSVYATATAKISSVNVSVGDRVAAGDEIVLYDTANTRATLEKQIRQTEINLNIQELTLRGMTALPSGDAVKQLQNAVDSAEVSLFNANQTYGGTLTKISDQQAVIQNARDGVEKARDALEKARQALSDNAELLAAGAISQSDYNKAEDSVTSARDAVTNAENSLTNANNALRDLNAQLETNAVSVDTAQKNLDNANQNLEESSLVLKNETDRINYEKQQNQIKLTRIDLDDLIRQLDETVDSDVSPIDGIVTSVGVSRGGSVGTGTVLVNVADFNKLTVKSNISEYDIPKLALGQSVSMTSDGLPGKDYAGTVTKIGDSAAGGGANSEATVPVEISIDQIDGVIKPGFSLDLTITTAKNPNALMITLSAVKKDQLTGESYVFKIEGGVLRRVAVTLGIVSDMDVEVTSGLRDGDMIIASPADTMSDGMPYGTDPQGLAGPGDGTGGRQNGAGGIFRMGGGNGGAGGGTRVYGGGQ